MVLVSQSESLVSINPTAEPQVLSHFLYIQVFTLSPAFPLHQFLGSGNEPRAPPKITSRPRSYILHAAVSHRNDVVRSRNTMAADIMFREFHGIIV